MSNHVKLKGQVVSHCILKVFFCRNFIIEIVESVQPLVFRIYGCFHAKLSFGFYTVKPYIKQMLPFVFGTGSFFQSDMFAYYKTVILKIDKLAFMVFIMRYTSSKYSDTRVCSHTIERVLLSVITPSNV